MFDFLTEFNFSFSYLLSQIFALIGTILALVSMQKKKKIQLLNYNFLAAYCAILHYIFLGAWAGAVTKVISAMRNGIAAYETSKRKTSKVWPSIFVIFYIICGIATYKSLFSLLPTAATVIFTIAIYVSNIKTIRYAAVLGSLLWLIYNVYVFSIVGIISEVIFVINDVVAIWRYRKRRKKK
ncbi:YgjV family protein [Candidatus Saccharibacteria bacterium]|nr:YgjV family protein [Candidatus Saccharibacteria bacterium]MBR3122364.1 YgjV family protein [Candidatus Saccharibacteria bacterium]MBR3143807.1 YgjV family protein [Candidatus Saccharibacteria bacterium]